MYCFSTGLLSEALTPDKLTVSARGVTAPSSSCVFGDPGFMSGVLTADQLPRLAKLSLFPHPREAVDGDPDALD